MKTMFIALLCAALLLPLWPLHAEPSPDIPAILMLDEVLDNRLHLQSIAASNQALYIKSLRGVHRWRRGEQDARLILPLKHPQLAQPEDVQFHQLLAEGDLLFGLNTIQGLLYPLQDLGDNLEVGAALALDWLDFREDEHNANAPRSLVLKDGFLWGIYHPGGPNSRLVRFDMKDGGLTIFTEIPPLLAIAPFKDKTFQALDAAGGLHSLAPDSGTLQPLGTLEDSAWDGQAASILYHPDSDALYWLGRNALFQGRPGGGGQKLSDLIGAARGFDSPSYGSTSGLVMVAEGLLAALTTSGVCLVPSDAAPADKAQVRILAHQSFTSNSAVQKAAARLLGISLTFQPAHNPMGYGIPQEELMQRLLSRDVSADIYVLDSVDNNLEVLIKKGFGVDLGDQETVREAVAGMYPALRDWVGRGEAVYGLPVDLEAFCLAHSPASFRRLNLNIPGNFDALCDLYQAWASGLYKTHPETLLNLGNKAKMKQLGFDLYVDHVLSGGGALRFDTELFRQMMTRVEQMDTRAYEKSQGADNPFFEHLLFNGVPPFEPRQMHQVAGHENNMPLLLSAGAGLSPALRARVTVLVINPFSPHQQEAAQVIAAVARSLGWEASMKTMPDFALEGVQDPAFEEKLAMAIRQVEDLQSRAAAGESPAIFNQLIAQEQQRIADADSALRFLITKAERQAIREMLDALYVPGDYQHTVLAAGLPDLFQIYLDGSYTLEQFIKEADNRLELITREGQ